MSFKYQAIKIYTQRNTPLVKYIPQTDTNALKKIPQSNTKNLKNAPEKKCTSLYTNIERVTPPGLGQMIEICMQLRNSKSNVERYLFGKSPLIPLLLQVILSVITVTAYNMIRSKNPKPNYSETLSGNKHCTKFLFLSSLYYVRLAPV